jgi:hypothetical protein
MINPLAPLVRLLLLLFFIAPITAADTTTSFVHLCCPAQLLLAPPDTMTRHWSNPMGKDRNKRAKRVKRDLAKVLLAMEEWNDAEDNMLAEMLQKWHDIKEKKRSAARNRKCRQRKSWMAYQDNLTDRQFRRYFRMERDCFDYLCERIIENVGERDFKE